MLTALLFATTIEATAVGNAVQASHQKWHVDLGFGGGFQSDPDSRSSSFLFGLGYRLSDALELTLSTKGLEYGRATPDAARSSANLELGARWQPFGRTRARESFTSVYSNVQLEAGVGLARASLVPYDDANPFASDDFELGLGYSAGVRWLPMVGSSFAAGVGAWYVGQYVDSRRSDAFMAGFVVELGD